MKKKILATILFGVCMTSLTGCYVEESFTRESDNQIKFHAKMGLTKQELELSEVSEVSEKDYETVEYKGVTYYITSTENSTLTQDKLNMEKVYYKSGIFYTAIEGYEESFLNMQINLSATLDNEIVETNGTVSEDGRIVTFDTPKDEFYAYTADGLAKIKADNERPQIKGITNQKYYKNKPDFYVTDNTAVKTVKLNKKTDEAALKQNGKNTIEATDLNGNKATLTFYLDSKAPTVKGVSNAKSYKKTLTIYVKDNLSGIQSVRLDGKKIRTKKVTSGKYKGYNKLTVKRSKKPKSHTLLVTDKVDNTNMIKFKN